MLGVELPELEVLEALYHTQWRLPLFAAQRQKRQN